MLDRRYQVFVATSGAEMSPERRVIAQTLIGMGFSSWCVEQRSPVSTAIARRQIDDCDYVILLLGSQYGDCSVSGISYMHLEYIYAITKQKPMVVFMHADPDARAEELHDASAPARAKFIKFRKQLQQEVDQVFYYQNLRELEHTLRSNMLHMLECFPVLGWIRPQNMQTLQDEIDHLRSKLLQLQRTLRQCEEDMVAICDVSIDDVYRFEYRIQAYEDGHIHELTLQRTEPWGRLLYELSKVFQSPIPEEYFAKCLNDYLNDTALSDIQKTLPQVYAVGRAQILVHGLYHIKLQMRQNEWIVPVQRDEQQRMQWRLTAAGQHMVDRYFQHQNRNFQSKTDSYSNL